MEWRFVNLKNSKTPYNKGRKKKKTSSKNSSSKKGSSSKRRKNENLSTEVPFKDRPLWEKILIGICISILTVFPFIVILVAWSLLIYEGITGNLSDKKHYVEKRESNEDLYGKYLYLDKLEENAYMIVSEDEDPDKRLEWDEDFCGYYDDLSDGYAWYDTKREKWKYWFNGISTDYKDYGWMVCNPEGWKIEKDQGDWIKLPEKYDRSKLWYIKQEE